MGHKTKAFEVHGRYGNQYNAVCSCGWKRIGFEYWTQADIARHGHEDEMSKPVEKEAQDGGSE